MADDVYEPAGLPDALPPELRRSAEIFERYVLKAKTMSVELERSLDFMKIRRERVNAFLVAALQAQRAFCERHMAGNFTILFGDSDVTPEEFEQLRTDIQSGRLDRVIDAVVYGGL